MKYIRKNILVLIIFLLVPAAFSTALTVAIISYAAHPQSVFAVEGEREPESPPGNPVEDNPVEEPAAADVKCREEIAKYIKKIQPEYGQFINQHFQSDKPTSMLIDGAIERYGQYKQNLITRYRDFFPEAGVEIGEEYGELPNCSATVEEELLVAKEMLKMHVTSNAQGKQTTKLLDYYKALNNKLEKLHFDTAMLYGYFQLFADKLPCYAKDCVQSG